ncbi:MAG: amidohydrolase [Actinomycetota bacterium]|nr:amidohydrolase [Actinomycetota bacterium]
MSDVTPVMSPLAPPSPTPPLSTLRVALMQTAPRLGDVEHNLAELHRELEALGDHADVAVASELALHGYHIGRVPDIGPMSADDPRLTALGHHGPAVVAGFVETDGTLRYNSAAIVDNGQTAVQRKLYLVQYRDWVEQDWFHPGDMLDVHAIRGASVSVLVCNDLWQPHLPWLAAHSGAEVLVVVANSVHSISAVPVQRAWQVLLVHAAVALQCYVVFVNRSGEECDQQFWGGSCVVGPDGEIMAQLGADAETAVVELDLTALRILRTEWPLLTHSRFDLVAAESARRATQKV